MIYVLNSFSVFLWLSSEVDCFIPSLSYINNLFWQLSMLENGNVKALSNTDWLVDFKQVMLHLLIQTESN